MIDCLTLDRWDEMYGDASYIEVGINDKEAVLNAFGNQMMNTGRTSWNVQTETKYILQN